MISFFGSELSPDAVLAWIDAHRDEACADLQRYCRQPSIAAQDVGMWQMARLVVASLQALSAETIEVPTSGYPVIVGRRLGLSRARLAFYNHYDVQPPEPLDRWSVPPFGGEIRKGCLYGRGAADNKGNLVARMWAVRAWQEVAGDPPCDVTFVVEGEEEIGSVHLDEFARSHKELVQADGCLWETGYRDERGHLALYAGVKGILCIQLHAQGPSYDLHSSAAPLAPSAAWRLVEALAALCDPTSDDDRRVTIPGFYDAVRPPSEREWALLARSPLDPQALLREWGVTRLLGKSDDPVALTARALYEPTCNICGLASGYIGPGSKTVLPATAVATLDLRLVPDQDPARILAGLRQRLDERGLVDVEVVELPGTVLPAQSDVDTPLMEALIRASRAVYGSEPQVLPRMDGTGPMELLCQRYGVPAVGGAGVGYLGSHVHAEDEHIRIEDFVLGIKHIAVLLAEFAAQFDD
jgi:acetylornithine deacetylase/succinyl-diaminopimelate desuccinylase-like protein